MDAAIMHLAAVGFAPSVVFDVGAGKGYWAQRFAWRWPEAHFFCLEPLPADAPQLGEACAVDLRLHFVPCAVGDAPGEVAMNAAEVADSSSLLTADESGANIVRVPVETLDGLIDADRVPAPDLIKIDVQGFEMHVLRGARKRALESAEVVLIEVNLYAFAPGTPLAHEVMAFMVEAGFRLYDIAGLLRRPLDGALGQVDFVFVANRSPLVASERWR
ncbi:MAG: FkbM family methyltransferase [Tepidisphaeraceae bacterium]